MRFSLLLPALQTAAMVLIVWAPWAPEAHKLEVVLANGSQLKTWTLIPGPDAVESAQALNLPAMAIVVPVEFAIRKSALPNYKVMFYGVWVVGLLCWHMVGRFADDVVRWRRDRVLPARHAADMTFALIAVPSAILLASTFFSGGAEVPALIACGIVWIVITGSALLFRFWQFFRTTFKPPVS